MKNLDWKWAVALGAGALLLGPACQDKGGSGSADTQRSQSSSSQTTTSQAQDQAKQQSEQAADAQKKAADSQKEVASTQQDVGDAEKKLQEARQKEQQKLGEAQQSQQQARQSQARSQQAISGAQQATAQQSQQELQKSQQQSSQKTVTGQVVRANREEVVLRQAGGEPDLRLKVNADTPVTIGGQRGEITDLKEGTQVRAAYNESGGEPTAVKLDGQVPGQEQK